MPRSGKYAYKIVASSKASSFGRLVRLLTNRAVCLLLVSSICILSLLISFRQYPYSPIQVSFNKREDGRLQPVVLDPKSRRLQARNEKRTGWINNKHPQSANQGAYPQQKLSQKGPAALSPKNPNNVSEYRKRPKDTIGNGAVLNPKQNLHSQNNLVDVIRSPKQDPLMLSLEEAMSDNGNLNDSSRRPEDYDAVMRMDAEKDEYYSEIDPERIKLVENVELFLQRRKQSKYYHQVVNLLPEQTKGVILLTNYRSGSTFLGELFNQHPDVFYTFEPLFPFTGGCEHQNVFKAQLLHQILKCDFPPMSEIYRQVKGPMRKNHVDIHCLLEDFCFRKNTKELCQRSLCPSIVRTKTCKTCGPIHRPRAMNVCRSKKLSVIKAIRLCDIMDLKPILTDPSLDVKIVHLIRDPRGIESSRSKIHSQWDMKSNAEMTCKRMLHNGMCGLANQSDTQWLKDRYMKVRYEDLSTQPKSMASKIYEFVGLDFNQQIQSWIKYHTETRPSSKVNPYGTRRDSSATMQAWRNHLKFEQVSTIQNVCSEMLNFFAYKKVQSNEQLANLKLSLIS